MVELIVLVDERDKPLGFEEKIQAHSNGGRLHRAFSIFIFNSKGQMMLQLRSRKKHHFGGPWTNTCCSHPRKDESLEQAVHRRLIQEMGFDTDLEEKFSFVYRADDPHSGLTEHEYDHVFVGVYDGEPQPNPDEVDEWKWVDVETLVKDVKKNPNLYSPWFKLALDRVLQYTPNVKRL